MPIVHRRVPQNSRQRVLTVKYGENPLDQNWKNLQNQKLD